MINIIRNITENFDGCDSVIQVENADKIRLLQITDMQLIDAEQRRTPDRLRADEISAWSPQNFDIQFGNHVRSLVSQTNPELIFITGDMVYGSFDDNGTAFEWFIRFMDALEIPWAPVFGNHENESKKGVSWQCEMLEKSKYCLFKRGTVSGNGNYTVGIAEGDKLVRILHMIDSNGCGMSEDSEVINVAGIYPDQLELFEKNTERIAKAQGKNIPAFAAFHIPTKEFWDAEITKGYKNKERNFYTIGVDVPAIDGDYGFKYENVNHLIQGDFLPFFKKCNVEAVFTGHYHGVSTCISYVGIRWIYGLKTGQYDYHIPYSLGGTLVVLERDSFDVQHIPSLVPCAPFPGGAAIFANMFAK